MGELAQDFRQAIAPGPWPNAEHPLDLAAVEHGIERPERGGRIVRRRDRDNLRSRAVRELEDGLGETGPTGRALVGEVEDARGLWFRGQEAGCDGEDRVGE